MAGRGFTADEAYKVYEYLWGYFCTNVQVTLRNRNFWYYYDMRPLMLSIMIIALMLPLGACIAVPVERFNEDTMSGERGALQREYVPLKGLLPTADTGQKKLDEFDKKWQEDIQMSSGERGD